MTRDADTAAAAPRRLIGALLAVVIVLGVLWSVDRALRRPFWFDEILTIAVSSQPGAAAIRQALASGADASPPLFHFIEHAAGRMPIDRHIGYRLPSIVAFALTVAGMFLFVRRRAGPVAGVLAVTITFTTQLFTLYAVEARPYSMLVCAVMWGLVMWQRADRGVSFVLGCAICLCLATSLHYYGVLIVLPLAGAELIRWIGAREVRPLVWVALASPLIPLAVSWPAASRIMAEYAPHFWARPPVAGFLRVYDLFLDAGNWWGAAGAFVLIGSFATSLVQRLRDRTRRTDGVGVADDAVVIGLLALPPVTYLAAHLIGVGVTARYVLPTALGLAAGIAFVSAPSRRASWLLLAGFSGVVVLNALEERYVTAPRADAAVAGEAATLARLVRDAHQEGLPIAVSNGHTYLPLAFYRPRPDTRLVYLTSRDAAVRASGTDTMELNLQHVAPLLSLDVQPLDGFTAAHDRFLVYAGTELWDWLPGTLAQRGFALQRVADAPGRQQLMLAERVRRE